MDDIRTAVLAKAVDGNIACADAHLVAEALGVTPLQVGKVVNKATDLRFNRCQVGVFGYGPKPEGKHKVVLAAEWVPPEIEAAINERVTDNHISCLDLWTLAQDFKYPRLAMANIAEAMGLKITPCQLGCF